MQSSGVSSIEVAAVPEIVIGKRRFRGYYRFQSIDHGVIDGRTPFTYTTEIDAIMAAREAARDAVERAERRMA